jgi:hypothetical protein
MTCLLLQFIFNIPLRSSDDRGERSSYTTDTQFYASIEGRVQPFVVPVPAANQRKTTPSKVWNYARDSLANSPEADVREAFVSFFPACGAGVHHLSSHAIDGHIVSSLGKRFSQTFLWSVIHPQIFPVTSNVLARSRRLNVAPGNAQKGQSFSQALTVFKMQPNRRDVFAFFTNLRTIVYFKVSARVPQPDPYFSSDFDFFLSQLPSLFPLKMTSENISSS